MTITAETTPIAGAQDAQIAASNGARQAELRTIREPDFGGANTEKEAQVSGQVGEIVTRTTVEIPEIPYGSETQRIGTRSSGVSRSIGAPLVRRATVGNSSSGTPDEAWRQRHLLNGKIRQFGDI